MQRDRAEDVHLARRVMQIATQKQDISETQASMEHQESMLHRRNESFVPISPDFTPERRMDLPVHFPLSRSIDQSIVLPATVAAPEMIPESSQSTQPQSPIGISLDRAWYQGDAGAQWPVQDSDIKVPDWGTQHPDYRGMNKKGSELKTRVRWSDDEVNYIAKWYYSKKEQMPWTSQIPKMVSKCRQAIFNDPSAIPVFHRNHITDTAKLRNGFEAAERLGKIGKF